MIIQKEKRKLLWELDLFILKKKSAHVYVSMKSEYVMLKIGRWKTCAYLYIYI